MRRLAAYLVIFIALALPAMPAWAEAPASTLTEEGRATLRAAFAEGMDKHLIAGGSLLLIQHGATIFDEAYGYADLEAKRPFTTETVVQLASISKPHTATTIMRLVERGLIGLDTPVSDYDPALSQMHLAATGEAVTAPTMRQLLSHTAGVEGLTRGSNYLKLVYGEPDLAHSALAIAKAGLAYKPGTDYAYSELDYVIAAHIAEKVTGKPFETLLQELLAKPIGAEHTSFFPSQETLDGMARLYNRRDGALVAAQPRRYRAIGQSFDPAGALTADAHGVARLFQLHLGLGTLDGSELLRPETVREMQTLQPGAHAYGLGLNLSWMPTDGTKPLIRHGGAFGTMAWADYELDLVGVILTQTPWGQASEWSSIVFGALNRAGVGRIGTDPRAERGN